MHCPHCNNQHTNVSNTRSTEQGKSIWRRRVCKKCKKLFSTYEKFSLDYITLKKRNGKKVRYVRDKLFASIYDAFSGGKHVDYGDAAMLAKETVDAIEAHIIRAQSKFIATHDLIDLVTDILEKSDLGACYRYASFSSYRGIKFGVSK